MATKKRAPKKRESGEIADLGEAPIAIQPLNTLGLQLTIEGRTPLVVNRMKDTEIDKLGGQAGSTRGKKRQRAPREPETEFQASIYRLPDGSPGFPANKIKGAIVSAAHKDLGVDKVRVRKALFIFPEPGQDWLVRVNSPKDPKMRRDVVRLQGAGKPPDVRFRAEFWPWSIDLELEIDLDLLGADDTVNLFERAGYGVGIGEGRPEKSDLGWGRFQVKR